MALTLKNNGALRQLALRLREAPRQIQQQAAREIRDAVAKTLDSQFSTKTDPYGAAWTLPKDGGETMVRTGRLRRGFVVEVVPGGVGLSLRISNSQDYAQWLQRGTAKMIPRRLVPDATLPPAWRDIFDAAYERALATWYASTPMK